MTEPTTERIELEGLKTVNRADVYKAGRLAGHLTRNTNGGVGRSGCPRDTRPRGRSPRAHRASRRLAAAGPFQKSDRRTRLSAGQQSAA